MSKMLTLLTMQFSNPKGFLGKLVGWSMRYKNTRRIWAAVDALNIQPADQVLEIGCGPGVAVKGIATAKLGFGGHIDAIDHSALMVDMANRNNKRQVKAGIVSFKKTAIEQLQSKEAMYNVVFAINVHLFWRDVVAVLVQLRHLLYIEGSVHLFFQPHWIKDEVKLKQEALAMYHDMQAAGYADVQFGFIKMSPVDCIHVQGVFKKV
ncbi:MAG: class I SAM-dependent methyltransferase [Flavipsychrobacter sp.]